MKGKIFSLMIAALTAPQLQAAQDLAGLNKELEIMTGIMNTTLRQDRSKGDIRVRSLDATYLTGQGVLFEMNTSGAGLGFSFNFGELFGGVPPAPAAPAVSGGDYQFHIQIDDDELDSRIEEAMEVARDALRENREKLGELREQERELAWEMREYERRKRDLEFEKRHAEGERKKDLNQDTQELETELARLRERQKEVAQYAQELEKEQQQQALKQQEALQQQYKSFLAGFESNVADVLCKYGAGLRTLPQDEHVSLVLKNFMQDPQGGGRQDKIYVFRNQDVQACVTGKLNAQKLLEQVRTYQF
ncbi:hypothetical protein [Bowmanella dokdonensis]|uniref:Uncharacterized protein n=1 Tax=Bowmanella dokdonensis TaxID=751969 RepID=A0A939IS43_9ALTE|nr:hypothetical protein [Bowmanella dokdonensis]MBN7826322.1 hypothetical protein [Bowmanella dokdonensis]